MIPFLQFYSRVTIPLPATTLPDSYGQPNQNGVWPTTLAGFQVRIGSSPTSMIAVKRKPASNPATYTVDFLVPDNATVGNEVLVIVTQTQPTTTWNTTATVQPTAPAFWSSDGTANGSLLTLDADQLTRIDPLIPIAPDNTRRLLLFASGTKNLVNQNSLVIRITCESGYQALLVQDFATTLTNLPAIQQITIRIPIDLAGCGRARLAIDGSQDNYVFLLIQ